MGNWRRFFCLVLVSALLCEIGSAQAVSTAQISGIVRDQTEAVLPGVEVTATQTGTGLVRTTVTNETGSYVLTNLPIGPYRLEVSLPGFRTYVQTGIILQVNSNPSIDAVLEVGQVADQIEVQADAALVETRSTGVGQVVDNQRVLELPLNGRQATELILLSGLAVQTTATNLQTPNRNYPTVVISVGGGLVNGMTYLLDGGTHNDPFNNLNLPLPFPDALQEFKVETSALPAQYGHHSTSAINAVTKSGTNEFHGGLFEFVRNEVFNARNAFAVRRDTLKRNQFGGTLGGPIAQNKLFFFGGFQGTTKRSAPSDLFQYVPTADMLAGDFTAATSPSCDATGRQISLRAPFVGNRISPALFSPEALNLVKILPKTSDPCGLVRFNRGDSEDEQIVVGRMDYQWTNEHSLFGRYQLARLSRPDDYDGTNVISLEQGPIKHRVHSFVLGDTYLIGSGTVSSFRATLNRTNIARFAAEVDGFPSISELGVQVYDPIPNAGSVNVTNGFTYRGGGNNVPGHYNSTSFQFSEDISMLRGLHQIGLGTNYIRQHLNTEQNIATVPGFSFNGQVSGLGLADFLLGKPSSYGQGNPQSVFNRTNYIALYIQDSWKASSRLTLNGGIRWEPYLPQYSKHQKSNHFDKALFDQGVRSKVFPNAPAGLMFPGDAGMPEKAFGLNRWFDFAPRLGLAWDPAGDGQTSVRAAWGMFYDYPHLYNYLAFSQGPPFGNSLTVPFPPSFGNPWQSYPGGNPFPLTVGKNATFPIEGQYLNLPLHLKHPYMNQWNLSLQRGIASDWMVAANYVGSNTIHMPTQRDSLNPAVFIPGSSTLANVNQRRALYLQNPQEGRYFATINELDDGGTANYHALLVSVQRRRSNGLTVQSNYTWSHCIGDFVTNIVGGPVGRNYMLPNNRRLDRANCATDLRHSFNSSTVYETPQFANPMLRTLASNWQVSGIVRLQSGSYLTVLTGLDIALTAQQDQRGNQVLANAYPAEQRIDQWINPAAFAQPAAGSYGNLGRNSVLGPGSIRIDMGLTRTFQVRENQSVQFRAEAFNLPNHVNPNNPNVAINNRNFGRILSAGDPRIIQLALKYVF
jgi:hypothetical protein